MKYNNGFLKVQGFELTSTYPSQDKQKSWVRQCHFWLCHFHEFFSRITTIIIYISLFRRGFIHQLALPLTIFELFLEPFFTYYH